MKKDKVVNENVLEHEAVKPSVSDGENASVKDKKTMVSELSESSAKEMLVSIIDENEALKTENSALKKSCADVKTEADGYKDNWYRTAAEFENYKKRTADVRKNAYDDGLKEAVKNLLGIGDSVDRALAVDLDDKTRAGVELIKRQFDESLAALGITSIDPIGKPFDAHTSEAIATIPTDAEEKSDVVAQVYKKGYELRGRMLRYAQVVVYKFE